VRTPEEALQLLPDDPAVILDAARQLYPDSEDVAQRRPLLVRALDLLERQGRARAEDHRTRAKLYAQLARQDDAIAAYRQSLFVDPSKILWRYELAELFFERGQMRDARRELLQILDQEPRHSAAQTLLKSVTRRIAEKG
jgi:tetratricopeptide (TPR) repeat protein